MMARHEAEQLLGGFAAGILTEAEKSRLFQATLNHQEVFDALMDEEVLRELLADPEARKALLDGLATMPPARPWWRKPSALALAASLFLVVTSTLVLKRVPTPEAPSRQDQAPSPMAPAHESEAPPPAPARQKASPSAPTPRRENQGQAEQALPAGPSTATPPPAPPPATVQPAAQGLGAIAPLRDATPKAKAVAEEKAEVSADSAVSLESAKKEARSVALARPQPPTWSLERLEGGRLRLTVRHGAGHLYLLQRREAGSLSVTPRRQTHEGALTLTVYEALPGPGDALELFCTPSPVAAPDQLLTARPGNAWSARVWP